MQSSGIHQRLDSFNGMIRPQMALAHRHDSPDLPTPRYLNSRSSCYEFDIRDLLFRYISDGIRFGRFTDISTESIIQRHLGSFNGRDGSSGWLFVL